MQFKRRVESLDVLGGCHASEGSVMGNTASLGVARASMGAPFLACPAPEPMLIGNSTFFPPAKSTRAAGLRVSSQLSQKTPLPALRVLTFVSLLAIHFSQSCRCYFFITLVHALGHALPGLHLRVVLTCRGSLLPKSLLSTQAFSSSSVWSSSSPCWGQLFNQSSHTKKKRLQFLLPDFGQLPIDKKQLFS
jgi:hypothetical protein